jgi:hypothetical protein
LFLVRRRISSNAPTASPSRDAQARAPAGSAARLSTQVSAVTSSRPTVPCYSFFLTERFNLPAGLTGGAPVAPRSSQGGPSPSLTCPRRGLTDATPVLIHVVVRARGTEKCAPRCIVAAPAPTVEDASTAARIPENLQKPSNPVRLTQSSAAPPHHQPKEHCERHPVEPKVNLRRQLQRHVSVPPIHEAFS